MPASLSAAQAAAYRRDGIVFPLRVMGEAEAEAAMRRLAAIEARDGGRLSRRNNQKPHLLIPWLNDLVRHPAVLDAVESLLGPDILCWYSGFFAKNPGDPAHTTWHQDSTYWGLSSPDVVTAWIALTPSTPETGCMQVIPGTHTRDQVPHRESVDAANMLNRGQEIAVEVDRSQAVDVVLRPGEMSLHHVRLFHGSDPNRGRHRRVGYAIRYIPTHVSQRGPRTTASLVRGIDAFGHFDPEPAPAAEFDAAAVAFHAASMGRINTVLYDGAAEAAAAKA